MIAPSTIEQEFQTRESFYRAAAVENIQNTVDLPEKNLALLIAEYGKPTTHHEKEVALISLKKLNVANKHE